MAPMTTPMDVLRLREDTRGCEGVVHLNNAGAALPPGVVVDTMVDHLRREEQVGPYEAHDEAADRIAAVAHSAARLIGARADQIALMDSATTAWDRAFSAIAFTRQFNAGDRILVSAAEYASNVLPIMQVAMTSGARIEFIPDDGDGAVDVAAFERLLDSDVALVAITHCPSQNGLVNDVAGIGALLEDSDAWYLVDACQSVGQLPVDVADIGADFLSATGRKFLRGPRGTGFLYASDRALDELEPFPVDLHSATWLGDDYEVQGSARRFEYWEQSYAGLLGLGAAIDYALDLGIDAIAERIADLAGHARGALADIPGVTVRDRGRARSGIVTLTHERIPAPELVSRIRGTGVNVSLSTPNYSRVDFVAHGIDGLVRVSPHVYNTLDEVDRLVASIADAP